MAKEFSNSRLGLIAGGAVALLVGVYFFLPVVYLVPLTAAWNRHYVSTEVAVAICKPLSFFYPRPDAYQELLDAECDFCRAHGFDVGWF